MQGQNKQDYLQLLRSRPYTRVEIIDQNPVQCLIQADGRRGQCKLVIRGKIPSELRLYASEIYTDPTEDNCTWVFNRPRVVTFDLKDTKSATTQTIDKGNNGEERTKTFNQIYLKFETITDCCFNTEVTFPEQDDLIRRKRKAEQANVNFLDKDSPSRGDAESRLKGPNATT